jgi:tetratricopeptide (TPR) repeat protein
VNTRFVWSITFGLFLFVATCADAAGAREQATNDNVAEARIALNEGVQAYRKGQIDIAIQDFKKAKDLDHSMVNASLYLATAYSAQFVPGDTSASNLQNGNLALEEFKEILTAHPDNVSAIDGTGSILYNLAGTPFNTEKMEESKSFHQRHVDLRPQDPEPYYWIGVIDWTLAFHGNREMRDAYNKTLTHPIKYQEPMPPELATLFAQKYGDTVAEGMRNLEQAIELRPAYGDAMAYLNLMYRQKADMEVSTVAREKDIKTADDLVDQVKAIIKAKQSTEAPR